MLLSFFSSSDIIGIAFIYLFFGIGLSQLIYIIPLCIWLSRRRRYATIKGVITGAIITLLLNGGCFLAMASTF